MVTNVDTCIFERCKYVFHHLIVRLGPSNFEHRNRDIYLGGERGPIYEVSPQRGYLDGRLVDRRDYLISIQYVRLTGVLYCWEIKLVIYAHLNVMAMEKVPRHADPVYPTVHDNVDRCPMYVLCRSYTEGDRYHTDARWSSGGIDSIV